MSQTPDAPRTQINKRDQTVIAFIRVMQPATAIDLSEALEDCMLPKWVRNCLNTLVRLGYAATVEIDGQPHYTLTEKATQ